MNAPDTTTAKECAAALGITSRAVRGRASAEAWPHTIIQIRGGKQRRFFVDKLPKDTQITVLAFRARRDAERERICSADEPQKLQRVAAAQAEFANAKGWRIKVAELRMNALVRIGELRAEGLNLAVARECVSDSLQRDGARGCGISALKAWGHTVQGMPRTAWLALLLPDEKGRRPRAKIHPAAWKCFKVDYLRPERPKAASCYRRLKRIAMQNQAWKPLPSLDTFERRISEEIPAAVRVLAREGEEALERLGPKILRDRTSMVAMEAVNSDGHKFDVAVQFPDASVGRPIIVGWQDIASGKLLSWRIGQSETADLVRLSFCDMVERYGIPQHAFLDNGRAYASKQNTGGVPTRYRYKVREEDPQGVLTRLGTQVHWVTPYNGKAKPIERAWGDLAQDISKRPEFAGAYLGNSPENKPENYGSRAVPWDEFLRVVTDGIAEHNARVGRRSAICGGRSFDTTFADLYARAIVTKAPQTQLAMLLLASEVVKVHNGTGNMGFAGNFYWSEATCEHQGELVELRFDPGKLHEGVHVFTLSGTYIAKADCVHAIGHTNTDDLRRALRAKKAYKRKHKELLKAEKTLEDASAPGALPPIPEPPPMQTNTVVRMLTPKRKQSVEPPTEPTLEDDEFERLPPIDWVAIAREKFGRAS